MVYQQADGFALHCQTCILVSIETIFEEEFFMCNLFAKNKINKIQNADFNIIFFK